jgi:squalene-associated FAD-dependent desaturase
VDRLAHDPLRLMHRPAEAAPRVLVIGAGWAGCAAALACARQGLRVSLHEAARIPGGRARTVNCDGLMLDNGQHLLLGAYRATRALLTVVHGGARALRQERLELAPLDPAQEHAIALRAAALPAPLGLAVALLRVRGVNVRERLGAMRAFAAWKRAGFRCAPDVTVAALLATMPAAVARKLWTPLCLAALNTPPERASAQVFLAVVQAAFDTTADAADAVTATRPLSAVLPEPAVALLRDRGHAVALASRVRVADADAGAVHAHISGRAEAFDAAIVAVGPHQLTAALAPALQARPQVAAALAVVAQFAYEPITTVYLGYAARDAFALPRGLVRLDDAPGQWLFDRTDLLADAADDAPGIARLLAVVISASGPHDDWPQARLAATVQMQLAARMALPAPAWSRVIAERRATYACTPGLPRPPVRIGARLFLAGDYVHPRFPATLEAAVASGEGAAQALARSLPALARAAG